MEKMTIEKAEGLLELLGFNDWVALIPSIFWRGLVAQEWKTVRSCDRTTNIREYYRKKAIRTWVNAWRLTYEWTEQANDPEFERSH